MKTGLKATKVWLIVKFFVIDSFDFYYVYYSYIQAELVILFFNVGFEKFVIKLCVYIMLKQN